MLPARIDGAVREFLARARARYGTRLDLIRLFGSYARGDWRHDSDVDILVVVRNLVGRERREIFDLAWYVWEESGVHVAPFVLSDEEWAKHIQTEQLIADDIQTQGISL